MSPIAVGDRILHEQGRYWRNEQISLLELDCSVASCETVLTSTMTICDRKYEGM